MAPESSSIQKRSSITEEIAVVEPSIPFPEFPKFPPNPIFVALMPVIVRSEEDERPEHRVYMFKVLTPPPLLRSTSQAARKQSLRYNRKLFPPSVATVYIARADQSTLGEDISDHLDPFS
jgi:hypothetical protein